MPDGVYANPILNRVNSTKIDITSVKKYLTNKHKKFTAVLHYFFHGYNESISYEAVCLWTLS